MIKTHKAEIQYFLDYLKKTQDAIEKITDNLDNASIIDIGNYLYLKGYLTGIAMTSINDRDLLENANELLENHCKPLDEKILKSLKHKHVKLK